MLIISGDRQTGRTTRLIELSAEAETRGEVSYIICHSHAEAYRIKKHAQTMGLYIAFPLTYREFESHNYSGNNTANFYIDNAELLLQFLTRGKIAAITIGTTETGEDNGT
jgi:hypothetical protein